jgi:dolichol kinase
MAPFWQQTTTTTQPPAAREWYDYPGRILAWYQRGGAPPPEPPPYSRNWHNSGVFLTALLVVCATLGAGTMGLLHEDTYPRRLTRLLTDAGVAFQRTARTIQEIERKLFHCLGLLVPWGYYTLSTTYNYPKETCVYICLIITLLGVCFDLLRIHIFKAINDLAFVQKLLRSEERDTLCGCSFFAVGNSMAIMLARRPAVAVTALMYLTLGDTAAALVGVAFGAHPINISETKKKSIEGSLAMFAVCFTSCSIMLADVTLVEYVAVFSALVATLVELYAPCGVNDNLAIPVLSVVALDFALQRVGAYG